MSWVRYKLGDVCIIEKGKIGIQKAVPGAFPLVVTAEERLSHNEAHFEGNAVVIPLVSSTGHGHKSLKRIHFQSGKFAVGNILCVVMPKDETFLRADFLYRFLDLNREKELVSRMKGMANVTLPMKEIANIEIPIPPIKDQISFVQNYNLLEEQSKELNSEIEDQVELVKQLRQAFLREAMQGKLTEEWRNEGSSSGVEMEPASVLLEKIKAEKEQLIKDKKIKKEKPLPPISKEEIPFEIPENWVWCRLGEIADLKSGNQYNYSLSLSGTMFVKVGDMNLDGNEYEIKSSTNYFQTSEVKSSDLISIGSIIFPKRGGAIATNKRRIVRKEPILIDSNTMAVIPNMKINFNFFYYYFTTVDLSKFVNEGVIPQVNNKDLNPITFALPPLLEQDRIVKKLDKLMKICDDLEASIKESQQQNEALLQQVLREALEPETKNEKV